METALIVALSLVNPTETLIVLTSDHSHVLTMGGQATPRGHPVLGEPFLCPGKKHGILSKLINARGALGAFQPNSNRIAGF